MPLFLETFLQFLNRKHCHSNNKCGSQTWEGDCIWIFTNSLNIIHVKQMHNLTIKKSEKFTQKCHFASLNDSYTSWSQPLPGFCRPGPGTQADPCLVPPHSPIIFSRASQP